MTQEQLEDRQADLDTGDPFYQRLHLANAYRARLKALRDMEENGPLTEEELKDCYSDEL